MADRIFAAIMLTVSLAYGFIAFTIIKAPFQYEPLGPETWPRVLSIAATLCLTFLVWRPDVNRFDVAGSAWLKLFIVTATLFAYAKLYQPFGFVIATFLFVTFLSRLLGATWKGAALFGLGLGVVGYFLCAYLMGLNLPAGPFPRF